MAAAASPSNYATVRWAICGTGKIAHDFATAIRQLPDVQLVAVGSREQKTADEFAKDFNIPNRFSSYEQLAVCNEVDVVYVAVPNSAHKDVCVMMLQHGRNVVVEKPVTCNAQEAQAIVDVAAKEKKLFMEGMWTRFMPTMNKLQELIKGGKIGDVKYVSAHIGFSASSMLDGAKANKELYDRVHKTELGGGAILDVGSYGVSFASWILGPEAPTEVNALAYVGSDGIDQSGTISLKFGKDSFATILMSSQFNTCDTCQVMGSKGYIEIAAPWQASDQLTLHIKDKEPETFKQPINENKSDYWYPHCSLFQHEANHVAELLRSGKIESPIMGWRESVTVMGTLDKVRAQVGVHLENDDKSAQAGAAAGASATIEAKGGAAQAVKNIAQ